MATTADLVISQLTQSVESLGEASSRVAAAEERAALVHKKMTAAGFLGIARGIVDVKARLQTIQAGLGGLVGSTQRALVAMRTITDRKTLEHVGEELGVAITAIDTTNSSISQSIGQMDQALERVGAVLDGGQPEYLLSMIHEARRHTAQAAACLDQAHTLANAALIATRQADALSDSSRNTTAHPAQRRPAVLDSSMANARPAEQRTAARVADDPQFDGRTFSAPPPPDPGHDWTDDQGRTYDALGDGSKAQYFQLAQFTRSIDSHLLKSNDYTVIDVTGYTPTQIAAIKSYVDSLPSEKTAKIIRVGF